MARRCSDLWPLLVLVMVLAPCGCIYPEPLDDDEADDDDDTGDDDTGDDDTGDDDTGDDDTGDDDTGDDDTGGDDVDGDGWTVEDGDCDDGDAGVFPGGWEYCDEKDNDCNGIVNDGTTGYDAFEPDDDTPTDLGDLTEAWTDVDTYPQAPGDVDRFRFWVDDDSDLVGDGFYVYAQVDMVPAGVNLSLTLNRLTDHNGDPWLMELDTADTGGAGAAESVQHAGTWGANDDGYYEVVVVTENGYDCTSAYQLYIDCGS